MTVSLTEPILRLGESGPEIADGSTVSMSLIGVDKESLHCVTPYKDCCKPKKNGEWYFVSSDGDKAALPKKSDNQALYRNRGQGVVRLHVREPSNVAVGLYRCCLPNSCGNESCLEVTLGKFCEFRQYCEHVLSVSSFSA